MNTEKTNKQPIDSIHWIHINKIKANNYNPNHVQKQELQLLHHSLLRNGWLQPIIINQDYTIIDGYHRATLMKTSKQLQRKTKKLIPCVVLNLTRPEAELLTIRINRTKGTHTAYKMHDVIKELHTTHHLSPETIAQEIGANTEEIQLLLHDNIFQKENINDETLYNQAWTPQK